MLNIIFGEGLVSKIEKNNFDLKHQKQVFDKDLTAKIKACENHEEQKKYFRK